MNPAMCTSARHVNPSTARPSHDPSSPGRQASVQLRRSGLGPAVSDGPMLVSDMLPFDATPPTPDLLRLDDGDQYLLYRGASNLIFGPQNAGKSHLTMKLIDQETRRGNAALLLDYEKGRNSTLVRVVEHQIGESQMHRIGYWHPQYAIEQIQYTVLDFAARHTMGTVIIDAVGAALALAGAGESDNGAVARWYYRSIHPIVQAGITVVLVDHTGHDYPHGRQVRHPVGASAKMRVITGTAVHMSMAKAFSRERPGFATLTCTKDNAGHFTEGDVIGQLRATPGSDGTVFTLEQAPTGRELAGQILSFVKKFAAENAGMGPSKNAIAHDVGHSEASRRAALDELEAAGLVRVERVGNAHRVCLASIPGSERGA